MLPVSLQLLMFLGNIRDAAVAAVYVDRAERRASSFMFLVYHQ